MFIPHCGIPRLCKFGTLLAAFTWLGCVEGRSIERCTLCMVKMLVRCAVLVCWICVLQRIGEGSAIAMNDDSDTTKTNVTVV